MKRYTTPKLYELELKPECGFLSGSSENSASVNERPASEAINIQAFYGSFDEDFI